MAWDYKRVERTYEEIPEGRYRVRILNAEKAISKNSGNDMLVLTLEVSGQHSSLWSYISFLPDKPEITNRMLTQMFDAFGIEEGNFNLASYVGKAGAAQIKHDEQGRAKLHYFLNKGSEAEKSLPPFESVRKDIGGDNGLPIPSGEWTSISEEQLDDLF